MRYVIILVSVIFLLSFVSADVNVSSCGNLDIFGERYVLQNDLISSGNDCILINASNIIFEGNGYKILGNSSNSSNISGLIVSNEQNVVLKNLHISGFANGVMIEGINNSLISSTIYDNSVLDLNISENSSNNSIINMQYIKSYSFSNGSLSYFEKTLSGKIYFLRNFLSSGTNLSNEIVISNSFASILSSVTSGFNVQSRIYFYNTSVNFTNATILRDGIVCPLNLCVNLTSLNSGNVIFDVPGWSNYSFFDYGISSSGNSSLNTSQTNTSNNTTNNSSNVPSQSSNSNSNSGSNSNSASSNSGTSITTETNSPLNNTNNSLENQNLSNPSNYNYLYGNQPHSSEKSKITGLFTGDFSGSKISSLGLVVLILIVVIVFLFFVKKKIVKHRMNGNAHQI